LMVCFSAPQSHSGELMIKIEEKKHE